MCDSERCRAGQRGWLRLGAIKVVILSSTCLLCVFLAEAFLPYFRDKDDLHGLVGESRRCAVRFSRTTSGSSAATPACSEKLPVHVLSLLRT